MTWEEFTSSHTLMGTTVRTMTEKELARTFPCVRELHDMLAAHPGGVIPRTLVYGASAALRTPIEGRVGTYTFHDGIAVTRGDYETAVDDHYYTTPYVDVIVPEGYMLRLITRKVEELDVTPGVLLSAHGRMRLGPDRLLRMIPARLDLSVSNM